jgi:hypothetical protein
MTTEAIRGKGGPRVGWSWVGQFLGLHPRWLDLDLLMRTLRKRPGIACPLPIASRYGFSLFISFVLLTISAPYALGDDVSYAWRYDENADGPFLLLGSAEATDDFVFLLSCSDDHKTSEMVVYNIGGAKVGQPVKIELSRDGARASVRGKSTTDKRGFVFAEAKNFPVRPLISVLDGEGPVKMLTGKTVTLLPDEGRSAELAEFAARCSPD